MLPNPELFGIQLNWYPFFHWLGVFSAFIFGIWYYRRHEAEKVSVKQVLPFLLLLLPLALVGSRIAGMTEAYVSSGQWPSISILWASPARGQFRWCGTLLAFIIVIPLMMNQLNWGKTKVLKVFDVIAISLCLLTAIVKQGCLFSGDGCYGVATLLPWGMHFPYGPAPSILPVHPTPIYDGIFHLTLFALLILWNKRKTFAGQTALIYFAATSVFYILLEIIRINPQTSIGLTVPQLSYLMILAGSVFYYFLLTKTGNGVNGVSIEGSR